MAYSIMGLNSCSQLFTSPVNFNSVNPMTNLLYGASVSSMYANKLSASLKSAVSSHLSSLNKSAYELKSSSQALMENDKNSIFNSKIASSDSTAVSASASKGAKNAAYKISVTQLAQAQKNKGSELSSDAQTSMQAGKNSFKINIGNKETEVSFYVNEGDTNKDTLNNMAKAINDSNSGVTAKVITDDEKKTSHIEITGSNTGADNSFTIENVSGNALEASGASAVLSDAKNAVYKINEKEYTSQSNTVSLDDGKLKLTLNAVTGEKAEVTVTEDKKAIAKGIEDFAEKFNQALSSINSSGQSSLTDKLGRELKSVVSTKQGSLGNIGINVNSDSSLEIDENKLNKVLSEDPEKVKRVIGGFEGIASKTNKLADRVLTSSSVDPTGKSLSKNDFNSFYSYLRNANKNMFLRNQSMGLFIDALL